jgi:acylphosphatase
LQEKMILHPPPKKTLHLVIHGRVQGVFFRDSMRHEAQYLSIAGWVRNRSDGTVEAAVQGYPAAVDAIVRWAQHGPERAQVTRLEIEPHEGCYGNFEVIG